MNDLRSIVILGRQPSLGLAELESLYGSTAVLPISPQGAALTKTVDEINFERLGGSVKLGKLLTILDSAKWDDIERYLVKNTPELAAMLPAGKLQIGISAYGFNESSQRVQATGLSLKKAIKKTGRSVRLTPNQEPALSSAQVQHNHLTGTTGWELLLVKHENKTFLAQTVQSQDIDSYTLRDRSRPKRDTRVGMLPPKLAQIIINLGVGQQSEQLTVLDPFCGTGVVLQEALLIGYDVYGTDIEPRMIDYSGENLDWLDEQFELEGREMRIEVGDATSHTWEPKPNVIAGESYLGRPFTSIPSPELLNQNMNDCNSIIRKFLKNVAKQTESGFRLCIAIPAWQFRKNQFKHLPLIDQISDLGYNQVRFEHVESQELLYYREDQVVARELLVITRK
jgi:tRNA G10  N-methylase Trm11